MSCVTTQRETLQSYYDNRQELIETAHTEQFNTLSSGANKYSARLLLGYRHLLATQDVHPLGWYGAPV